MCDFDERIGIIAHQGGNIFSGNRPENRNVICQLESCQWDKIIAR
jgi:hypothetical protein